MDARFWLIQAFNGISYGALLFLVGSGLSLIFGVMRIVNLAHGSYFLLGGYVALSVIWSTGSWLLSIPVAAITHFVTNWWLLPILGVVVGYVTNWLALWMIYEPTHPHQIGPFRIHGLFIRRQPELADVYARIVSDEIITMSNFGDELLHGPRADRTRQLIESAMRPFSNSICALAWWKYGFLGSSAISWSISSRAGSIWPSRHIATARA